MSDAVRDAAAQDLEALSTEMDRALARAREVLGESTSTWAKSAAVLAKYGLGVPQPTAWPPESALLRKKKRKLHMAI
jgi:hypothetical protein